MIIEHIKIQNMRGITEREINLAPGLNIVFGPNESGKSTTFEAMLLALFDIPTGKKAEQDIIPWGQHSSPLVEVKLKLTSGDETTIIKNYNNATASIKLVNENITEKSKINKWLAENLGTDNRSIFTSSLHISQSSLSNVSDENSIVNEVWRIISSEAGDVSIDNALKDLEKAQKKLGRGIDDRVRKDFGGIRIAQDQIKDLNTQINDAKQALKTFNMNNKSVDSLTGEWQELNEKIEATDEQIKKIKQKQRLENELKTVEAKYDELNKKYNTFDQLNKDYQSKKKEFEPYRLFNNFKENQFTEMERLHKRFVTEPKDKSVSIFQKILNWFTAIFQSIFSSSKSSNMASKQDSKIPERLKTYLDQLDCGTYDIYIKKKSEFKTLQAVLKEKRNGIKAILDNDKPDDLKERLQKLFNEKARKEEQLSDYSTVETTNLNDLEQKLRGFKAQKQDKNDKKVRNETLLETSTPINEFEIEQLQQELEETKSRETYFQHKFDTYTLAIEMLNKTKSNMAGNLQNILGTELSNNFSALTEDRYSKVDVNGSLEISLTDAKSDMVIVPDSLSTGTHDQIYFATRLALINALYTQVKPPIILDDPFVHFDEYRLANALSLLESISHTHQVILFTCRQDVEQLKNAHIKLEML